MSQINEKYKNNKQSKAFLKVKNKIKKKKINQNDKDEDLVIGNIPDLNKATKKKLPKIIQIKKNTKKLKREKELLSKLNSEEKQKAEHMLKVQKAILKSEGQKVYNEKSLKKRQKNMQTKKDKSRMKWENKKNKEQTNKNKKNKKNKNKK
ncbi:conserved Plasmodium protein, unknown function [Plasmodium sp. gorilla clade G2]|uniref:conserved Plasmodium protein, unknown function n=1 Tax=Plasmodium sp. gorilla clade G2 TaxID=880535 RepID=UPI000D225742|nr:conserved Plasmodium protein, unknown function [Plasmodium sp. gorilla clade G2]SOV14458.1 conserved Plasmodium protein, unknown function [Plasmodium sp. gorilla clade G2]